MSEIPIPEDLKIWYSVACDKVHFATDYDAIKTLIERIGRLEAENARLKGLSETYRHALSRATYLISAGTEAEKKEAAGRSPRMWREYVAAREKEAK
jgi:hypothetical protein